MVEHDQERPLTPSSVERKRTSSLDDEKAATHLKTIRRKRCVKCCGCITVSLLVPAIVIVILIFTVFRMKEPTIKINKVTITHLELVNNTVPKPGTNISLIADVSVKNPNVVSFRYEDNTTSSLYYHGVLVGEARSPPGHSKARRTMRMNATVDIMANKLMSIPQLSREVGAGLFNMDSVSVLAGRMKIWFIKKHVTVKMDCSVAFNMTTQAIEKQRCSSKVDF